MEKTIEKINLGGENNMEDFREQQQRGTTERLNNNGGQQQKVHHNNHQNQPSVNMTQDKVDNSITSNKLGLSTTGAIFTFTTHNICDYLSKFFADKGLGGVKIIADAKGNSLRFYAIVSINDSNVSKKDTLSKFFVDSDMVKVSMNEKLRTVMNIFIDDNHRYLAISERNRKFCFATLDPKKILAFAFNIDINTQAIDMLDIQTFDKHHALIRMAKFNREITKGPDFDIEDLVR